MSRAFRSALTLVSTCLLATFILLIFPPPISAQNSYDSGTPAASKTGQSTASTYAMDKIETINLANQNLSLHIPLVTIGGRGSASYTLALSYNSKLWSAQHDQDPGYKEPGGIMVGPLHHYSATFDDAVMTTPNVVALGSGWTILAGPALKVTTVNIDSIPGNQCPNVYADGICGYKYVLTRLWLTLPDGSQVELRDNLTDGAPALTNPDANNFHASIDRDRGRVWHSTDGSAITYITDVNNGVTSPMNRQLGGWLFLADGTRFRMEGTWDGHCTKIVDRNGNFVTLDYGVANPYATTYTDELGRQVIMSGTESAVTITVKGYGGVADRLITIDTQMIGALTNGVATNLRADFRSIQRPLFSGDYLRTRDGDYSHTWTGPHTDLFEASENPDPIDEHYAATTLHLLDGRALRFRYNQYGELAEIVYPGGGVSQIDYAGFASTFCEAGIAPFRNTLERRVVQRRSLTDGVNVDAVWVYSRGSGVVDSVTYPAVTVEAHEGSVTGTLLASEIHYFLMLDAEYRICGPHTRNLTGYEKWQNAKEFRVERQTGSGTQIEKRTWEQRASVVFGPDVGLSYSAYVAEHGQEQPPNDPRVTVEDTILEDGKMKRVTYGYDNFNNVTSESEYDFGGTDGSQGTVVRKTFRTYGANIGNNYGIANNGLCYSNLNPADSSCGSGLAGDVTSIIHQRHLLLNQTIKDANDNQKAHSEFEYDNYSTETNHAGLVINSGMLQYDGTQFSLFSSSNQPRGNVTKASHWAGGSNYISSYSQYDNAGNVIWTKDPNGNVTTVSYVDNCGDGSSPDSGASGANGATFAFATLATNALGHQAKTQFDYTRGVPTGAKDPNGTMFKTEYDLIGRPVRATSAVGLAEQTISEVTYPTASSNVSTTSKQMDATRWLASKSVMDGFDRVITAWQAEDGQHANSATFTIRANTVYDALGRVNQVSNPYRPASETAVYTTRVYDLAGRVVSVTTPDNAVVNTFYNGNQVLVKDQAGKERMSQTNGLGQPSDVWEITAADDATESISFPNRAEVTAGYRTKYEYNTLENLITVTQQKGSTSTIQTRSFSYDSLSRLTSATNPESGTITYQYDDSGNLLVKTDARSVSAHYSYDALNRATRRWYNGTSALTSIINNNPALPSGVAASNEVNYAYDSTSIANGKGRLASVSSSVSSYSYSGYDALGRALGGTQTIYSAGGNQAYLVSYTYDLAGHVTLMTYPSQRAVNYNYDSAGRLGDTDSSHLAFSGNLGSGGNPRTYSSITGTNTYDPAGHLTQEQLGTSTAVYNKLAYNSRGQLAEIRAGTASADDNRGKLVNWYSTQCGGAGCNNSDNNGNLMKQEVYVPNNEQNATPTSWYQQYGYDSLNRLTQVHEYTGNTNLDWQQAYTYDRWGNRTINNNSNATWGDGINSMQMAVVANTTTNRMYAPGETESNHPTMNYDNAGNQTKDTYSGAAVARVYDAENRMTSETQANSYVAASYSYDGDGRRVKRTVGSMETWQVYGLGGELLAEYAANTDHSLPQKEYGYRNGQLLVTATITGAGWGSAPTFTDDPLNPNGTKTDIKLVHLTELRNSVNALRTHAGLSTFSFTVDANPTQSVTTVKADHIRQLRTALEQALTALHVPAGGYTHSTLTDQTSTVYAVDFQELRNQIKAAWGSVTINWLVTDQLGTPRMIFDQSGSLANVSRHDYLPFGEELSAGLRSTTPGYTGSDNLRQKFTQKERDIETGLDYFGARYYASTQGRFTSVDPVSLTSLRLHDPQRMNLYNSCRNNPLKYFDSDGQEIVLANARAQERAKANIDPMLRENERKNITIVGDKVVLVNRNAIDVSSASPAYQGLFGAITDSVEHRYFALAPGESAKPTGEVPECPVFTYDYVHTYNGATVQYDTGDTDSFVPVADDMTVEGMSGDPIPFSESRSFYHEMIGEALGNSPTRDPITAVRVENRIAAGATPPLPQRSGNDHAFLVDPSKPFKRTVTVRGSAERLTTTTPDPNQIQPTMRPLKKP